MSPRTLKGGEILSLFLISQSKSVNGTLASGFDQFDSLGCPDGIDNPDRLGDLGRSGNLDSLGNPESLGYLGHFDGLQSHSRLPF